MVKFEGKIIILCWNRMPCMIVKILRILACVGLLLHYELITLHNLLVAFHETMYHVSIAFFDSKIPHLWGALKLCTMDFSTNNYKFS